MLLRHKRTFHPACDALTALCIRAQRRTRRVARRRAALRSSRSGCPSQSRLTARWCSLPTVLSEDVRKRRNCSGKPPLLGAFGLPGGLVLAPDFAENDEVFFSLKCCDAAA